VAERENSQDGEVFSGRALYYTFDANLRGSGSSAHSGVEHMSCLSATPQRSLDSVEILMLVGS
jgi:hypothetical protein